MLFLNILALSLVLFQALDAQLEPLTLKELKPFILGKTIQELLPTLAENAGLSRKISPRCLGKILMTSGYCTDQGAAAIFENERIICVATPYGWYPCFNEKAKLSRFNIKNPFSEKKAFINLQTKILIRLENRKLSIPHNPRLIAYPIVGLPGACQTIRSLGLEDSFTLIPEERTTAMRYSLTPAPDSEHTQEQWDNYQRSTSSLNELIKRMNAQLKKGIFDTNLNEKRKFTYREGF